MALFLNKVMSWRFKSQYIFCGDASQAEIDISAGKGREKMRRKCISAYILFWTLKESMNYRPSIVRF